jgi:hypothetical protein
VPCCGRPPSARTKRSAGARRTFFGPDRTWGLGGGDQERLFRGMGPKEPRPVSAGPRPLPIYPTMYSAIASRCYAEPRQGSLRQASSPPGGGNALPELPAAWAFRLQRDQ